MAEPRDKNGPSPLREHLRRLKSAAEANDAAPRDVEEWRDDLRSLMDTLYGWLRDAEAEGLLRVHRATEPLSESKYGDYDAPSMTIEAPEARTVRVRPVGLDVVGSAGRVDLECGPRRARLIRMGDRTWKIATPSRASRAMFDLHVLDARTFEDALDDLLMLDGEPFVE